MGKGEKTDFTQFNRNNPGPGKYNLDNNQKNNLNAKYNISRKNRHIHIRPLKYSFYNYNNIPGPGSY